MLEPIPKRAKRLLREFLYPNNKVLRGGLTRASEALGVSVSTIRSWCISKERIGIPSEANAYRILAWLRSKPKIKDNTGIKLLAVQDVVARLRKGQ